MLTGRLAHKQTPTMHAQASNISARAMGGGLATYSRVSAVRAEIVEGTLPTSEAPSKSLRPELLEVCNKLAEHRKAR